MRRTADLPDSLFKGFGSPLSGAGGREWWPLEDFDDDQGNRRSGLTKRFTHLINSQVRRFREQDSYAFDGDVISLKLVYPPIGNVCKHIPESTKEKPIHVIYRPPQWNRKGERIENSCSIDIAQTHLTIARYSTIMKDVGEALYEAWTQQRRDYKTSNLEKAKTSKGLEQLRKAFFKFYECEPHIQLDPLLFFGKGVTRYFNWPSKEFKQRVDFYAETKHYRLSRQVVTMPPHENCLCRKCCEALSINYPSFDEHFRCDGCRECIAKRHIDDGSDLTLFAVFHPQYAEVARRWAEAEREKVNQRRQPPLKTPTSSTLDDFLGLFEQPQAQPERQPQSQPQPKPASPEQDLSKSGFSISSIADLEAIRDTVLHEFRKKPLTAIPKIVVEPSECFREPVSGYTVAAYYEASTNRISFNFNYLTAAPQADLIDAMTHELLHAWLHQHGLDKPGEPAHGPAFETACLLFGIEYNPKWPDLEGRRGS